MHVHLDIAFVYMQVKLSQEARSLFVDSGPQQRPCNGQGVEKHGAMQVIVRDIVVSAAPSRLARETSLS